MRDAVLATTTTTTTTTANVSGAIVVIPRPHLVLGARGTGDLNDAARAALSCILPHPDGVADDDRDEDDVTPMSVTTIGKDGNAMPRGDDGDRVVFKLRLMNTKKKAMTMMPEEALALIVLGCKRAAH